MTNPINEKMNELFPYLKTIGVRFLHTENKKIYSYIYYLRTPVRCGDLVIVPTRNDFSVARVISIVPGANQIYRGVYGVIQVDRFKQVENEFKNRIETIANLVRENNQLYLKQEELVRLLDNYKEEKKKVEDSYPFYTYPGCSF